MIIGVLIFGAIAGVMVGGYELYIHNSSSDKPDDGGGNKPIVETYDGGCLMAYPVIPEKCECDSDPNGKKYVGCKDGNPQYFDNLDDLPNGVCL